MKVATTDTNSKNQKIVQRTRLSVMRDIVVCKLLQQSHIDAEDLLKFTELLCAISIDREARSIIKGNADAVTFLKLLQQKAGIPLEQLPTTTSCNCLWSYAKTQGNAEAKTFL